MIDTAEGLARVAEDARRQGRTALDTEMVWERTFFPALGVIQVGLSRQAIHLLDAVALGGALEPLGELLADGGTVKILHDAVQDLTVLRQATGRSPRALFDTRVAAGFVGLASTISLRDLVRELTGVELEKTETRTDWLQRPLAPTQIGYAEDDVRYLVDARDELERRARARGLWEWLQEEMTALDDGALYEDRDPLQEYRRVKGYGKLRRQELAVLRELSAWREVAARRVDRPRGRVASDKLLIHLSQRQPTCLEDLSEVRSLRRRDVESHGEGIVSAVNRGLQVAPQDWPTGPPQERYDRAFETRAREAMDLVKRRSLERGIDAVLVATRADVRGLVRDGTAADGRSRLARGWRRLLVGGEVIERWAAG